MADKVRYPFLEQSWRWFGPQDGVTLSDIRQAGATAVVSALHQVACGEVWPLDEIARRKAEIEAAGLRWSVVESVPVHEDIKQGCGSVERYLDNYRQSLWNLSKFGIETVCYNFMAVTDWTRTDVAYRRPSGAESLRFDIVDVAVFDIHILERRGAGSDYDPSLVREAAQRWDRLSGAQRRTLSRTILLGLPGTVDDLTVEEFRQRLACYESIDAKRLRQHHADFLKFVIPTAEEVGIKLAIHPDDPPFPLFGLPRIAGDEAGLEQILDVVDSPANGITFCTGSLGAVRGSNLPDMLRRLGERVHFLHLRNVRVEPNGSFFEDDHLAGSTDMAAVMFEVIELMARRGTSLPMRPDHGARMLGDLQRDDFYPGYSAVGRLRGLAELRGLEAGLRHLMQTEDRLH